METGKNYSLSDALNDFNWINGGSRALVHISDGNVADFADGESIGKAAEAILGKDILYAAVCGSESADQFTEMANAVDGIVLDGGDMQSFVTNLAAALLAKVQAESADNPGVYTTDDVLRYQINYSDPENDPVQSIAYKYNHDPYVFSNNTGEIGDNGVYGARRDSLEKVGRYDVYAIAKDAPGDIPELSGIYGKWSDEASLGGVLIHQSPIALLDVSLSAGIDMLSGAGLTIEDHSYDPDHIGEPGEGIRETEWKWKTLSDTQWTYGPPPESLPYDDDYLLVYRVRDIEGAWSYPAAFYLSTRNMRPEIDDEPPVIAFSIEKTVWTAGETIEFETSATDNDEVARFMVYLNGSLLSEKYGRQLFAVSTPGEVTIEVVAIDFAGNESRLSQTVTIVEADRTAPQIALTEPVLTGEGALLSGKVNVVATITDETALASWTFEMRPNGGGAYTLIGSGYQTVDNGVIGVIDTTSLDDGLYECVITARDAGGNYSTLTFYIEVDSSIKDTVPPVPLFPPRRITSR